jgi:hypothetical protein
MVANPGVGAEVGLGEQAASYDALGGGVVPIASQAAVAADGPFPFADALVLSCQGGVLGLEPDLLATGVGCG